MSDTIIDNDDKTIVAAARRRVRLNVKRRVSCVYF